MTGVQTCALPIFRLTSDVTASSSLLFVLSATRSFRCCGVKPSGPPEDPAGKLQLLLLLSLLLLLLFAVVDVVVVLVLHHFSAATV